MADPHIQYALVSERYVPSAPEFVLKPLHAARMDAATPGEGQLIHVPVVASVVWHNPAIPVELLFYGPDRSVLWGPKPPNVSTPTNEFAEQFWWDVKVMAPGPGTYFFQVRLRDGSAEIRIPFELALTGGATPLTQMAPAPMNG